MYSGLAIAVKSHQLYAFCTLFTTSNLLNVHVRTIDSCFLSCQVKSKMILLIFVEFYKGNALLLYIPFTKPILLGISIQKDNARTIFPS